MEKNIVTVTDSYKLTHSLQYRPGTQQVYSYFEARKGAKYDYTMFVGLQPIIKDWLCGIVVTKEMIDKAEKMAARHFGSEHIFNRERWDYIVEKYGGKLPIEIKAVPEGMKIPVDNILMDVINTDHENCGWLTNHLETLLTHVWYPSTVGTLSSNIKDMFKHYLEMTCDDGTNFGGLNFMLHDFGKRGVSSMESASIGGMAHLVNFWGTDTVIAMEFIEHYYNTIPHAYSVPASEHSVMTAGGKESEEEIIEHLLDTYPTGILSLVSDSYDIYNCVENIYGKKFKDKILARDGKLVVRPDSGDPVEVSLKVINLLGDAFGYTVNNKGFKVLNPKVGFIWGDGIDHDGIKSILEAFMTNGWSAENCVFGMGSNLLQRVHRDTQRFAFKSSAQKINGVWKDVYKDPLDKSKVSKRGILKLIKIDGEFKTVREDDERYKDYENILQVVYRNGEIIKEYTFDEVIANSIL